MAVPTITPLPPALQKTLEEDLSRGTWTTTTRDFFLQLVLKLKELEARIAALEP